MINLDKLIEKTINIGGSDLHLTSGIEPMTRKNGKIIKISSNKLTARDTEKYSIELLKELYKEYTSVGEIDMCISLNKLGRLRINVYKERGNDAIAIRILPLNIPTFKEIKIPKIVKEIIKKPSGLILVTGPTGSGKSTTLASIVEEINSTREGHIITLEDPIEFLHNHNKCIVNQREIEKDTKSYISGLKSVLRQDPDVILIGEIRDRETMAVVLKAAETGHLVLSTLHTIGACRTIDRIIDMFNTQDQYQIRTQLSSVLEGVISQTLIPRIDENGRECAYEIMISTPAIRNLIREGKTHQIQSLIQTGTKYGMKTIDMSIGELYMNREISYDNAINYVLDKDIFNRIIRI